MCELHFLYASLHVSQVRLKYKCSRWWCCKKRIQETEVIKEKNCLNMHFITSHLDNYYRVSVCVLWREMFPLCACPRIDFSPNLVSPSISFRWQLNFKMLSDTTYLYDFACTFNWHLNTFKVISYSISFLCTSRLF